MTSVLQFYKENPNFIDRVIQDEEVVSLGYCVDGGLSSHEFLIKLDKWIDQTKKQKNLIEKREELGPEFPKELSLVQLTLLKALVAQKEGKTNPLQKPNIIYDKTPPRFQEKFKELLGSGFVFLGEVIRDSLSEDSNVNCGNPFGFLPGDLGYWWAGVVINDWAMSNIVDPEISENRVSCADFYKVPAGIKLNQVGSLGMFRCNRDRTSTLDEFLDNLDKYDGDWDALLDRLKTPLSIEDRGNLDHQFLDDDEVKNFFDTIDTIDYNYKAVDDLMACKKIGLNTKPEMNTSFSSTGKLNNNAATGEVSANNMLPKGNSFAALLEKINTTNELPTVEDLEKAFQNFGTHVLDLTIKTKEMSLEILQHNQSLTRKLDKLAFAKDKCNEALAAMLKETLHVSTSYRNTVKKRMKYLKKNNNKS